MSGKDKSAADGAKKKSKSRPSFPAQKLDEITVTRARSIASQFGISNYSKINKDALIPLIREQLTLVQDCVECGGGPCAPDIHTFPATEPGSAHGSVSDGSTFDASKADDSSSRAQLKS